MIDADFVFLLSQKPLVKHLYFLLYIEVLCFWQEIDIIVFAKKVVEIGEISICALFLIAVGFIGPVILHKGLSPFYLQIMSFSRHLQQHLIK